MVLVDVMRGVLQNWVMRCSSSSCLSLWLASVVHCSGQAQFWEPSSLVSRTQLMLGVSAARAGALHRHFLSAALCGCESDLSLLGFQHTDCPPHE